GQLVLPLSDVASVWSPSVAWAVEEPVWPFFERLAVVRAGDRPPLLLGSSLVCCFSEDVEELVPGDDSSPPSASTASSFSLDGPPCTVTFGMSSPSSTRLVLPHSGQRGAPTE
ncbi:hypothetical protein ACWDTP_38530, partial [Mycobacterium sp. NPDC003449]